MALDFHRLDNNEYLFGLDENKYNLLDDIFQTYKSCTGISIDQYGDTKLSIENQKTLIKIVDDYISKTNLMSRPEIGLHKNVNLWNLEYMKTKRA